MANGHHLPSSLISETFSSLGDFDACLSVQNLSSQSVNSSSTVYTGKYCLVHLTTSQIAPTAQTKTASPILQGNYLQQLAGKWVRMGIRLGNVQGICIPSFCTASEMTDLIKRQFAEFLPGITVQVQNCQVASSEMTPISKSDFFYTLARTILASFLLLSLACTLFSPFCMDRDSLLTPFVQSFNLISNFTFLWYIPSKTNSDATTFELHFINGLRVLLNGFIIAVHSFIAYPTSYFSKVSSFSSFPGFFTQIQADNRFLETSTLDAGFFMDHFFILSGFLMAYTLCARASAPPRLLHYIAIRWLRLVPSIIALFSLIFVLPKLGSGPLFYSQLTDVYLKPCRSNWWKHLLFLNNWTNFNETCETHLWFIACDSQLFYLLYPILVLFFWRPIWAFAAIAALIVSSFTALLAIVCFSRLSIPNFGDFFKFDSTIPNMLSIKLLYTSPQMYLLPYFIGVLIAFYLIKSKARPVASSIYQNFFIAILFILIWVALICPIPAFVKSDHVNETLFHLFLHLLHTFLAGTLFYRVLIVRHSILAHIYTCPFFIPLSRLSYGMYLVHPALIWFNLSQIRAPQPLHTWYQIQFFLTIYVQSFLVSIFLYVFVESPFYNLHKKFSKRLEKDSTDTTQSLATLKVLRESTA